ncbi:HNH endonuclease [Chloroflexota bacterium]
MAIHREANEVEKKTINEQHTKDGLVRCFVNGHPIDNEKDIDYHHVKPFSLGGATEVENLAPVCSDHHKRIGTLSIEEFRARLEMEEFFNKPEPRRLNDILEHRAGAQGYSKKLKLEILKQNRQVRIYLDDKVQPLDLPLSTCPATSRDYFYIVLPIKYIQNDSSLQPRPLEMKRVWDLFRHLLTHTQLSPAVCRYLDGDILLFDGQHKSAAQIWAGRKEIDCKIYIDPDLKLTKDTNLTAHDKLRQMPFFSSVLINKWADLFKEEWLEYIDGKGVKSETGFVSFLTEKGKSRADAINMLRSYIFDSIIEDKENKMSDYISERNRTRKNPLSVYGLTITIFRNFITAPPLEIDFELSDELREKERINIIKLMNILTEETLNVSWNPAASDDRHRRAERIYAAGSLKAWTGMLRDVVAQILGLYDKKDREMIFLRDIQEEKWQLVRDRIRRLFIEHKLWADPSPEVDNNLRVNNETHVREFLASKGLTVNWILGGKGA